MTCDECDVRSLGRCIGCAQIDAILNSPWAPCLNNKVYRASMVPPKCTFECALQYGCVIKL